MADETPVSDTQDALDKGGQKITSTFIVAMFFFIVLIIGSSSGGEGRGRKNSDDSYSSIINDIISLIGLVSSSRRSLLLSVAITVLIVIMILGIHDSHLYHSYIQSIMHRSSVFTFILSFNALWDYGRDASPGLICSEA